MTELPGWRSPFGAAEDRNIGLDYGDGGGAMWRSPFGAAEDRNVGSVFLLTAGVAVEVALWGG